MTNEANEVTNYADEVSNLANELINLANVVHFYVEQLYKNIEPQKKQKLRTN